MRQTWHLASLAMLITLGEAALAVSASAEELTAVLTQIQGNVTVVETAATRGIRGTLPEPRRAQSLQIVRSGDEVHLPAGAGAGFVCSTDRWVMVSGDKDQRLSEELCRSGKPLPPGTYHKLAPGAGRLRSLDHALVLEAGTRGFEEEGFGVPVLLSPRNTAVLDPRPAIQWAQVPDAMEYEIELNGPKPFRIGLDASQVACAEKWRASVVCTQPYPAQAPDLPPGTLSFLSIRARLGLASPLRQESQPSRLRRLPPDKTEEIRAQLQRVKDLPVDEQSRQLLAADLYAHEELFAAAISLYWKVLAAQDLPEARVTLGDALLETGLLRLAAQTYQETLDRNPESAVVAAAELGLGRVEYARRSFEHAECHFRKARDLYRSLGLKEEAAAADLGVKESGKKKPQ